MPILEIKKYPDPILKRKSQEVKEITEEIKKLIEDMIETMKKNNGAGLAAPQVGILKRVIVVETGRGPVGLVNPKILRKSKEVNIMEEGCLSFPGLWLKIKRWKGVEIEALDGEGKKIKAEGIWAGVLQHEIDHLDGILFIDKINPIERLKIRKKLKEIEIK